MVNKIQVKLILEIRNVGLSRNDIAITGQERYTECYPTMVGGAGKTYTKHFCGKVNIMGWLHCCE